jgi:hypothetical protein
MRRLFWLAMGVTIGALIVRKLSRVARHATPRGIAQDIRTSVSRLTDAIRSFLGDVRYEMAGHEAVIREGVGLDHGSLSRTRDDR